MDKQQLYNQLGKILVQKLREENYSNYVEYRNNARSHSITQYESSKNPNLAPELQRIQDDRFKFISSLTEEQLLGLNQLVLSMLDNTAFNFLREVEENLDENSSIGMTIEGQAVASITSQLLSGTLFGEYFLWLETYSEYGPFHH